MREFAPSRVAIRIEGLDCAEEVRLLKQELEERPGIVSLEFDLLSSRMVVVFDAAVISPETILASVASTGMSARLWEEQSPADSRPWWLRQARSVLTSIAGGLLLAGFASHAVLAGSLLAAFGFEDARGLPLVSRSLYGLSILVGLWLVAPKAWASLARLRPDMNLLMSIAVVGAMILDEWFEAATVTFLFSAALLLEHWSMGRARRAIEALMELSPPTARCLHPDGEEGRVVEQAVDDVAVGATVVVRPGERIPLDGLVRKGTTSVDQAPISGESISVSKQPGDEVFAGTINQEGAFEFEVTKPAKDTTLARILHMVEEAGSRRAPSEQWVETFARYYTPAMMALALTIAVTGPLFFAADWSQWTYNGLVVLVIACPCALVISTPVSVVSGMTAASRRGVLIKGGRFLEAAADLPALALDKTGTLTYGQPAVQQIVPLNGHSRRELLERAAAMEMHSQHPLARAILRRAEEEGITVPQADDYRLLQGKGAEGVFAGKTFWIGSHRLVHEKMGESPDVHLQAVALEDAGHTVVAVGTAEHVCGLIAIADRVRDGASGTVEQLRNMGVRRIVLLTGDNEQTAREVARVTGVDDYRAELLPEDKVREVEQLRRDYRSVAMIGDGVNDAPAMAASTLGIAMGAMGTDAAIETADIALMSDDLSKLPWLIAHARRTLSVIRQNIAFALGLKAVFVVLTLAGAASLWMAIAADMGASLLVIFNGLRLLQSAEYGMRNAE